MYVYVPGATGDEDVVHEPTEPPNPAIVQAIRKTTDPAVAKRMIDAKIIQIATANRQKAEKLMSSLGIKYDPRSTAMGGLWTWLSGTNKLSSLSKYTPAEREKLMSFLNATNLDVIERTFTQQELDAIVASIRRGAEKPGGTGVLNDPYAGAAEAYKAEVVAALAPLGETAASTGKSAAGAVADGIVGMYRKAKSAPGRTFEWLGKAKWAVGLTALGVGGYFLWPKIKQYLDENSTIGRKLNAARTLLGGAS